MSTGTANGLDLVPFRNEASCFWESGCRGKKGWRGILDPLFQIVRHCSLKFGCLVWVMVWVMEQAERID
jgi:hypothetical protein